MSLRQAAFSAGRWTATSAALRAGLQLIQTLILARLLMPADFGLMAVAGSVLALLKLFSDLGVSRALVHFDNVSEDALSSLYWINLGVAALLMLFMIALSWPLGMLYRTPDLVPLLQLASLVFPLSACGLQYRTLAEKDLRFTALAHNEIGAALTGFCVALMVALTGGGVYALVAGTLATAAASSFLAWLRLSYGRHPALRFRMKEAKPYLRFGGYLVGENLANTLHRQADVFIGGLVLGPAAIGLYSLPRDLSLKLATVVNPIITRVGFPIMARARHQLATLNSVYMQTLRMTASVNFPIYVGLSLFSDEVVSALYGSRFAGAGDYLRILAMWGLLRSMGSPVGSLLHAVGATRRALVWNLGLLATLPAIYWIATWHGGLSTLAISMVGIQALLIVPAWRLLVHPCCGASLAEFMRQVLVPLSLALLAGASGKMVSSFLDHTYLRLLAGGTCIAIVYLILSFLFNRRWLTAMFELLLPTKTHWMAHLKRGRA